MKLLILNYEYPPLGGGAGVITQNIAEGLSKLGHEISVVTTWFQGEKEVEIVNDNLKIIRLKSKRKYLYRSNPREMLSWISYAKAFLKKHLVSNKYDLCFANFALPGGEVAYSLKMRFQLPYVIISHGHDIPWFMPKEMMWYHALTYQWIKTICVHSKRNYVQSNDMKTNIDAFLGPSFSHKNKIIYNGWNSTVFSPDYSLRKKQFTILFPGRLVKQKDPMSFLKAINIIKNQIDDFKVIILGDGVLRKKMEKFTKANGFDKIVEFKLWVSKEEMLYNYRSASLTVLPSLNEGMSIATLEALACGQYLIATEVSNNKSLIKEDYNGNFIETQNPKDIANKILNFYNTKFLNNYLIPIEDLNKYHNLFEWDKIIKEYEQDLLSLI
ncbi:MAG: glycosyltransferase family 4 protein [Bacteroidota bacterium]|jgi:glycosyltransferase involved in cell wall biosynthesis|nr:glycosyltransferase family 4 protein [Bacteroidales bacterium]MDI9535533.1 glycosyltransferase family 4 protein [Bacteroidota bacterium]NLP19723.1 glycosyltransferase family 4 protein [Bacteroidales bacterium]OQC46271.1 MAG: GalNAc-alpha-(1->4)-GalNAc-alpha-(1->3)-diNAcBac-PP-undecaprenol alpha-1,4-N-acetyl-D-galactosaminyltransferase [Bacteroidetes bacterium ADurb.Bin028]